MRTVAVIGTGTGDDPRRPDLPDDMDYSVLSDNGDTMVVEVAAADNLVIASALADNLVIASALLAERDINVTRARVRRVADAIAKHGEDVVADRLDAKMADGG